MNAIRHWHHAPGGLALKGNTGYGNAVDHAAQALRAARRILAAA